MAKTKANNDYTKAVDALAVKEGKLAEANAKANGPKATAVEKEHADKLHKEVIADRIALKRLRFRFVGKSRVNKAVAAVKLITNLGNRRQYDFNETDIAKIETALKTACDAVGASMRAALAAPVSSSAPKEEAVSFD